MEVDPKSNNLPHPKCQVGRNVQIHQEMPILVEGTGVVASKVVAGQTPVETRGKVILRMDKVVIEMILTKVEDINQVVVEEGADMAADILKAGT